MPPAPAPPHTALRAHLEDLVRYTDWANRALVHALEASPLADDDRTLDLLSHTLRAQDVWLGRVQGSAAAREPFWHRDTLADCARRAATSTRAWLDHLAAVPDAALFDGISYTNSKGVLYTTPLHEIVAHVVNHGTHHRAQIVARLREHDHAPPALDYIYYQRSR